MRSSRARPQYGIKPYSLDRPLPPCAWMAASTAAIAASAAAYLAMLEDSPAGWPWSCCQAARLIISAASSVSILALASGCETPWWLPIGSAQTLRSAAARRGAQGIARDADAEGGSGDPFGIQAVEDLPEPLPFLADQGTRADPDAVEVQGELAFRQQQVDREQVLVQARGIGRHDERGQA